MKRWGPAYRSGFRITLLLTAGAALPLAALAQDAQNPVSSAIGKGLGYVAELISLPSAGLVALVLSILQSLLSALLEIVAFFLNNVFYYNLILTPNRMPVVVEVWSLMRDIANSFFILIILWIAFTIIFNLENLGGKKLLARVIIVALLINFSLAMVSLVFGFANVLAKPFRDATEKTDIAGFIMNRVRLQTIGQATTPQDIERYKQLIKEARGETTPDVDVGDFTFLNRWGLRPSYAAKDNPPSGCGFGALADSTVTEADAERGGCLGSGDAVTFASSLFSGFTQTFGSIIGLWSIALAAAIGSLFLILVIASFIAAAVALLARIIAMVFLSVLAPLAFLAFAAPGGTFAQWGNRWLSALFKWAFFAPAFYFLFYLSLRVLATMTETPVVRQSQVNFAGNILQMLPLLVFLGFLWASIMVARWLGIAVATDIGMKFAKWAGGLAMGATKAAAFLPFRAAALAARPLAARGAAALGGRIAGVPLLRNIPGVQRGLAAATRLERNAVDKAEGAYKTYKPPEIARMLPSEIRPAHRAAMVKRLAETGDLNLISDEQATGGLRRLQRVGENVMQYLRQKPALALQSPDLVLPDEINKQLGADPGLKGDRQRAALRAVISGLRPEHIPKIERGYYLKSPEFMEELWLAGKPELLRKVGEHDPELFGTMMEKLPPLIPRMRREIREPYEHYFRGSPGQQVFGYRWPGGGEAQPPPPPPPSGHIPPAAPGPAKYVP